MIESGSSTPGVDPATFGLPAHTAVRYERPAAGLREAMISYHVLDSEREHQYGRSQWLLPTWPSIRFILSPDPILLTIGSRRYDPIPAAALYGTTSKAMRMTSHGGVTIGVDLTPIGWARLFRQRADELRDRVVPLDTLLPPAWVQSLMQRLRASDQGAGVKPVLDEAFATVLGPPRRDEPQIRALARLIAEERTHDLTAAAEELGMSPTALRRLSTRYFGFPPKTLLIRTRFMRTLVRMLLAGEQADYSFMPPSYFDASHFLRDAARFLGMTPRRFLQEPHEYLVACLRARAAFIAAVKAVEQGERPVVTRLPPVIHPAPPPAPPAGGAMIARQI
jgi:AraC-like DNA-binding protein